MILLRRPGARISCRKEIDRISFRRTENVCARKTQNSRQCHSMLEGFLGSGRLLPRITPKEAEAFIASRIDAGLKTGTVNKDIRTLKRVFNLAIEPRGYLRDDQNPFAKIRERKQTANSIRYVTVQEYRALMSASGTLWWKALLSTAYCCGLRRSEIPHLTWADIDFHAQRVRVSAKESGPETIRWEPKDHQTRLVPMSNETAQILADLQADAPEGFPYIFISPGRFRTIKARFETGNWNDRKAVINNLTRGFEVIPLPVSLSASAPHMTFAGRPSPTGHKNCPFRWSRSLLATRTLPRRGSTTSPSGQKMWSGQTSS